jgi:hypothetical protein
MPESQEVIVESLITAIQHIQHERMTGILTIRRGDGITYEEGSVTFIKGQITQTKVGRRNGPDALNALSTWSNCSGIFNSPNDAEAILFPSLLRISSPTSPVGNDSTSQTPLIPAVTPRVVSPLRKPPTQRIQQTPITAATPGANPVTPTTSSIGPLPRTPSPLPLTQVIPRYTLPVEEALRRIDAQGLSRVHRHLFLLIDKQRPLPELARLLKRPDYEVLSLLRDLENAAVITLTTS